MRRGLLPLGEVEFHEDIRAARQERDNLGRSRLRPASCFDEARCDLASVGARLEQAADFVRC